LIIKAAAGGGGRGMKVVNSTDELPKLFRLAQSEAEAGFGNADCFIERYCAQPRHIEVQLIADEHGQITHLGERECSIQRRHQKLIEESPSVALDSKMRAKLGETAVRLAAAVGYQSLGTAEFLMDTDGQFYFMEVNTRLQVEHPVTEIVTGIDLVKEQIKIALGEKLPDYVLTGSQNIRGHALECRINAEDPYTFAPWPGKITAYHEPGGPGVRLDSMLYAGYKVSSFYDSMIAKLITFGKDRQESIARMRRALGELKIDGIRTNASFHLRVLDDSRFNSGDISTRFLDSFLQMTGRPPMAEGGK
jgi:acetyl-CoA carboxylase biotin carboxylase subunit